MHVEAKGAHEFLTGSSTDATKAKVIGKAARRRQRVAPKLAK
jgi:hypothetical protein